MKFSLFKENKYVSIIIINVKKYVIWCTGSWANLLEVRMLQLKPLESKYYVSLIDIDQSPVLIDANCIIYLYWTGLKNLFQSVPQVVTARIILEDVCVIGMEGAVLLFSMEFVWMEEEEEVWNPKCGGNENISSQTKL